MLEGLEGIGGGDGGDGGIGMDARWEEGIGTTFHTLELQELGGFTPLHHATSQQTMPLLFPRLHYTPAGPTEHA